MDSHSELLNEDPGDSSERGSDDNQFARQPEEQGFEEQPLGEAAPPVQQTKKTAENFMVKEENALVPSWLGTSIDAVQDTEQSRGAYWQKIHDYFRRAQDSKYVGKLDHRRR